MARNRKASPTLNLVITEEARDEAIKSNSGGCLIADAIKRQYPNLSRVSVDMATIRVTDAERGERYIYLTPPAAQHVLLSFDQGWPNPTEQLTIRRAVKIDPIINKKNSPSQVERRRRRDERRAQVQAKRDAGERLSKGDKLVLARAESDSPPSPDRPRSSGPREVIVSGGNVTIRGGRRMAPGQEHPNLLRGRNRHFGAKMADPGEAFNAAVEAEVSARLGYGSDDPERPY